MAKNIARRNIWIALGAAVLVACVAGVVGLNLIGAAQSDAAAAALSDEAAATKRAADAERKRLGMFRDGLSTCNIYRGYDAEIMDLGETIAFTDVARSPLSLIQSDDLFCFLDVIHAPQALESKISATRALDGVQKDSWVGFEIEWRYHPDAGVTATIEHAQ